jgi:ABC-type antimicrobial peptide transport system permease subunit
MMVKLALRGLVAHKLRLGLTTFAVVLSVAFVSGTLTFSASLDGAISELLADSGKGTDTLVRAKEAFAGELGDSSPPRPIPGSVLSAITRLDGVAKAHGSVNGFAAVVDRTGRPAGASPQVGTDWTADPDFSIARLTSGRGPRTPGEVATDATTAKAAGYRVGDRVPIALRGGRRTFTLTGVFALGRGGAADGQVSMTAFEPSTAGRLLMERPGSYTEIAVHAKRGVSQQRLRDTVAAVLPSGLEAVTGRHAIEERAETIKDLLAILRTLLLAFAGIAVFVGSFIIFNTFSMLVAQRGRELALLRAVGASRAQVTRSVLAESIGVGVAGSTLGLLLGGVLAAGLSLVILALLGQRLPFGAWPPPASAVLWSYVVGLTVAPIAAYLPARRAGRIPPVAALRPDVAPSARELGVRKVAGGAAAIAGAAALAAGLMSSGRTALYLVSGGAAVAFVGITMLSPLVSGPVIRLLGWPFVRYGGAAGRLSRENARRNPRRTAATASALMIGLAVIGMATVVTRSIAASAERQIDAGIAADYQIEAQSHEPISPHVRAVVAGVAGVQSAVATRAVRVRLDGTVRTATAGAPGELVRLYRLRLEAGTTALGRDELLINRGTATSTGWHVGSTVPGEYQDGTRVAFRVAGIYRDVTTMLGTVPTMIIGADNWQAHNPGGLIDRIDLTTSQDATGQDIGTALRSALKPWPNIELKDKAEMKKEASSDINTVLSLVLVLLALSVVIAGLGIVNTLALSVSERTREIGLLRAVGLQRRQLRRMIRYEAVVISVYGGLLGLGSGVIFGAAIQNAMADKGMNVLAIPFDRLGLYVLAAAGIGVIAASWPARHAARTDILRAIGTE